MSDQATEWDNVQEALGRLQHELQRISTSLRGLGETARWRDEAAAALQVLQGDVELLARSLSQGIADSEPQDQVANLRRLRRELAALPVHNPDDGFSSRDHDNELYREPR